MHGSPSSAGGQGGARFAHPDYAALDESPRPVYDDACRQLGIVREQNAELQRRVQALNDERDRQTQDALREKKALEAETARLQDQLSRTQQPCCTVA